VSSPWWLCAPGGYGYGRIVLALVLVLLPPSHLHSLCIPCHFSDSYFMKFFYVIIGSDVLDVADLKRVVARHISVMMRCCFFFFFSFKFFFFLMNIQGFSSF
jgi:hypothetical protein